MANWFVSSTGSDANAGTAWNTPFLTIGKALLTGSTVAAGDTVWIEPGVYRQQNVTVAVSGSGGGGSITIRGDVDGAGFRASGSTTPLTGEVRWTAWDTSDSSISGSIATVLLNGQSYLIFQSLLIVGGKNASRSAIHADTAGSTNIQFLDCAFLSAASTANMISFTATAGVAATWTIDRCRFLTPGAGTTVIGITLPTSGGGADYNVAFTIRDTLAIVPSGSFCQVFSSGALANFGGGVVIANCTVLASTPILKTTGTSLSTSIPCQLVNSVGWGTLSAGAAGQVTENFNYFYSISRTNVTAGASSKDYTGAWAGAEIGQAEMWGRPARPFLMPSVGSTLLGFGGSSPPAYDGLNRPRPAGGGQALWGNAAVSAPASTSAGYLERHDTLAREGTTVQASTYSGRIDGPGDQEFRVAVDAASTTISFYLQADTNYGTTNPPQVVLLANGEIGVATQTYTMSPTTTGQWNAGSLSAFTPSAKGIVTLRLVANPAAGSGKCFIDTLSIS